MSSSLPHPLQRPALAFGLALLASCVGALAAAAFVGWVISGDSRERTGMEVLAMSCFAMIAIVLGVILMSRGLALWRRPRGRRGRR